MSSAAEESVSQRLGPAITHNVQQPVLLCLDMIANRNQILPRPLIGGYREQRQGRRINRFPALELEILVIEHVSELPHERLGEIVQRGFYLIVRPRVKADQTGRYQRRRSNLANLAVAGHGQFLKVGSGGGGRVGM